VKVATALRATYGGLLLHHLKAETLTSLPRGGEATGTLPIIFRRGKGEEGREKREEPCLVQGEVSRRAKREGSVTGRRALLGSNSRVK